MLMFLVGLPLHDILDSIIVLGDISIGLSIRVVGSMISGGADHYITVTYLSIDHVILRQRRKHVLIVGIVDIKVDRSSWSISD